MILRKIVMLIKICGITRVEEVEFLSSLDIDYIGLVFANSKRQVHKALAKELLDELKKVIRSVGVFKNNSLEFIKDVIGEIPLDVVQLHGDEDEIFIKELKKFYKGEIWKAVSVSSEEDILRVINYDVNTIILDGKDPGSGQVFPWKYLSSFNSNKRLIIAGGINTNNVIEAIKEPKVQGIDVSSGVEGIFDGVRKKDKNKVLELISKVRGFHEGKI